MKAEGGRMTCLRLRLKDDLIVNPGLRVSSFILHPSSF